MSAPVDGNTSTDEAAAVLESRRQGVRNPACDHCREKKIRCDREKPLCMNCRTAKITCKYSEPQKRPSDVSRNIHRFQEVNHRLDRIEASIAALTTAVQQSSTAFQNFQTAAAAAHRAQLAQKQSTPPPCSCGSSTGKSASTPGSGNESTPSPPAGPGPPGSGPGIPSVLASYIQLKGNIFQNMGRDLADQPLPDNSSLFMGSSSIASMTDEASKLAQDKLRSTQLVFRDKKPDKGKSGDKEQGGMASLDRLQVISTKVAGLIPHYSHKILRDDASKFELSIPQRSEADDLINNYYGHVHWFLPVFEEKSFRRDLEQMYANPESMTSDGAWVVCFNTCMLFGLHGRLVRLDAEERKKNLLAGFHRGILSFYNAWSALDDLEVFMTPKLRNVQALLSMAVCTVATSRPALCWSLLAQAARSAQAMGLHRRGNTPPDMPKAEVEERKNVFWLIYVWTTTMSLTLGRSATLPEFDCDAELPEDDGKNPYFKNFIALIALSRVQSMIYVRLYSAQASRASQQELEAAIVECAAELRTWWEEWGYLADANEKRKMDPSDRYVVLQLKFSYYNSETLIHKVARPGMSIYRQSERKCLETSRASTKMVMDAVERTPDPTKKGLYLWLFSCTPFTSFFVLFSAIIRNPSSPTSTEIDLPLMQSMVTFFTSMKNHNEGAARLLAIASAFTNVAQTFLKNYHDAVRKPYIPNSARIQLKRQRPEDEEVMPASEPPRYIPPTVPRQPPPLNTQNFRERQQPQQYSVATPVSGAAASMYNEHIHTPAVDFQTASFLRWPGMQMHPDPPIEIPSINHERALDRRRSSAVTNVPVVQEAELGPVDMDLETLMAEPLDFQQRMEQAAMRGPLEFDWFGWDSQFGQPNHGAHIPNTHGSHMHQGHGNHQ